MSRAKKTKKDLSFIRCPSSKKKVKENESNKKCVCVRYLFYIYMLWRSIYISTLPYKMYDDFRVCSLYAEDGIKLARNGFLGWQIFCAVVVVVPLSLLSHFDRKARAAYVNICDGAFSDLVEKHMLCGCVCVCDHQMLLSRVIRTFVPNQLETAQSEEQKEHPQIHHITDIWSECV